MKDKPRVLAVIPARAGSKGIPGKNIRLLNGKPLICYTIESALASQKITTIMLSTDYEEAIRISKRYTKIEIPFIRPAELAMDHTPTVDVIKHAVDFYKSIHKQFDYVCVLQPTSPFRIEGLIDEAISCIVTSKADSLATIRRVPSHYNPHWTFKTEGDFMNNSMGDAKIISRRQELPEVWHRDGQVYISTIEQIEKGVLIGGKIFGFKNETGSYVNIDTKEDWEEAERILANGQQR